MLESLEMLDRSLFLLINGFHTPLLDRVMWQLSENWPTFVLIAAVLFAMHKMKGRKRALEFALGIALVFACTDFTANLIKHGVKRYRPTHNLEISQQVHTVNEYVGGKYGFFSGHAANTSGMITFVFLCLSWVPFKWRLLLFVYPLLVAYSRIYLGVHYPLDCVAGLVYGCLIGIGLYFVMNRYFFKAHATTT